MKILLIGASGMIGSHILKEASKRGYTVIAASRNPEKVSIADGVTTIKLDVNDAAEVAKAAVNADVIVSAVSPRSTGKATEEAEAIGAALIEAAGTSGKRLFVVGGAGTLKLPDGSPVLAKLPDFLVPEATGMRNVYNALKASSIDWTFFSPPSSIQSGEAKGHYRLGGDTLLLNAEGVAAISAGDYAHAVINELETPNHSKQIFTIAY